MGRARNSGYHPGDHWLVCDFCGEVIRSSKAKKTWEGYVVCPKDYEARHPQDFVRGKQDTVAAQGLVRTEPVETFSYPACRTRYAVAGIAIAGCALAGYSEPSLPESTF